VVVHPRDERLELHETVNQTDRVEPAAQSDVAVELVAHRSRVVEAVDDQLDNHHAILDRELLAGQAKSLKNPRDHAVRPAVDVLAGFDCGERLHYGDVQAGESAPRQKHEIERVVNPDIDPVDRCEGLVVGRSSAEVPERMERHVAVLDFGLVEHVPAEGFQHRLVRPVCGLDLLDRPPPDGVVALRPPRQICRLDHGSRPVRLRIGPVRCGPVRIAGRASGGGGGHSQSNLASSRATVAPAVAAVVERPRISRKCPGPPRRTAPD
jgi:hypothetical protein